MSRAIACIFDTLGALWVLCSLAIRSGFNFSSPYWKWRMNTAFPTGDPAAQRQSKRRLALEYARWAHRIRRLR
jgi:hypothetical protein